MFVDSCPEVGFAHTPMTSARYYLTHSWTECDNDHTVLQSSAGLPHWLHFIFRSSSFTFKACVSCVCTVDVQGSCCCCFWIMKTEYGLNSGPLSSHPSQPADRRDSGSPAFNSRIISLSLRSRKKIKIIHLFQIAWYKIQYFTVWAEPSFIHYTEGRD